MTDNSRVEKRWMTSSQYWEGWHDLFNRKMWGRGRLARAMKEGGSTEEGFLELS